MLQIAETNTETGAASAQAIRPRNRAGTERAIFIAARTLLAEEGFQGFGVNAVARRAGCDKQLIYRYYGGLNGLIDAIGADLGNWVKDRIPEDTGGMFLLTYGDLMEKLAIYFMDALREDPLVCKIVAWEVSQDTPQVRRLTESRTKALSKWLDKMRGSLTPPEGCRCRDHECHPVCRHPASGCLVCRQRPVRRHTVKVRERLGKGSVFRPPPGSRHLRLSSRRSPQRRSGN